MAELKKEKQIKILGIQKKALVMLIFEDTLDFEFASLFLFSQGKKNV